ncbi:hypothetical protein FB471_4840 [Amycolatopsis cihanbeyliensis]|uniref:Uncharacterized protein n=1 Tax=Amycolatopsis cihanbeyliensis TaxID=1128664 RepID=A0A542DPJ5_AMYCI|nr:hypothetical protein FB471_4840 [Amycolatopsis cihanbeyliensis]
MHRRSTRRLVRRCPRVVVPSAAHDRVSGRVRPLRPPTGDRDLAPFRPAGGHRRGPHPRHRGRHHSWRRVTELLPLRPEELAWPTSTVSPALTTRRRSRCSPAPTFASWLGSPCFPDPFVPCSIRTSGCWPPTAASRTCSARRPPACTSARPTTAGSVTRPKRSACDLAGTAQATRPLIGLCDSARCPEGHPPRLPPADLGRASHHLPGVPRQPESPRRRETPVGTRSRPGPAGARRHRPRHQRDHVGEHLMPLTSRTAPPQRGQHSRSHGPLARRQPAVPRWLRPQDSRQRGRGPQNRLLLAHRPPRQPAPRALPAPGRRDPASARCAPRGGHHPRSTRTPITSLKTENATLRERIHARDEQITELTEFKEGALPPLAAPHQEILRLRRISTPPDNVRNLPTARKSGSSAPCD